MSSVADLEKYLKGLRADAVRLRKAQSNGEANAARLLAAVEAEIKQVEAELVRVKAREAARKNGARPKAGFQPARTRQDDGTYRTRDGRVVWYDASSRNTVISRGPIREFGPRQQFVSGDGQGGEFIIAGLYTDPSRPDPTAGVVFSRPGNRQDGIPADLLARHEELLAKNANGTITVAELAELNRITAGLNNNTTVRLGLPGGGTFADARGQIVGRDNVIDVGLGNTETKKASISGILPRTAAGWSAFRQAYQAQIARAKTDIASIQARIDSIEAGRGDPGPAIGSSSVSSVTGQGNFR